jgi:hypothetical protein
VGQIHQVVSILTKARNAIVAALDDMHGHSGKDESEGSRHIDINERPRPDVDRIRALTPN